jgi:hypothetical protein
VGKGVDDGLEPVEPGSAGKPGDGVAGPNVTAEVTVVTGVVAGPDIIFVCVAAAVAISGGDRSSGVKESSGVPVPVQAVITSKATKTKTECELYTRSLW